ARRPGGDPHAELLSGGAHPGRIIGSGHGSGRCERRLRARPRRVRAAGEAEQREDEEDATRRSGATEVTRCKHGNLSGEERGPGTADARSVRMDENAEPVPDAQTARPQTGPQAQTEHFVYPAAGIRPSARTLSLSTPRP